MLKVLCITYVCAHSHVDLVILARSAMVWSLNLTDVHVVRGATVYFEPETDTSKPGWIKKTLMPRIQTRRTIALRYKSDPSPHNLRSLHLVKLAWVECMKLSCRC